MHIILGLLGAVVTILVLLHRLAGMGVDLGGLNPFLWRRRRSWRQKFEANPAFSLDDPLEIAALLVVGTAKVDGDMSAEEKRALLGEFETTFSLAPSKASELLAGSAHLLGDAEILRTQLDDVLSGRPDLFSDAQVESVLEMMERIAHIGGAPTAGQLELIDGVRRCLSRPEAPRGTWDA